MSGLFPPPLRVSVLAATLLAFAGPLRGQIPVPDTVVVPTAEVPTVEVPSVEWQPRFGPELGAPTCVPPTYDVGPGRVRLGMTFGDPPSRSVFVLMEEQTGRVIDYEDVRREMLSDSLENFRLTTISITDMMGRKGATALNQTTGVREVSSFGFDEALTSEKLGFPSRMIERLKETCGR